ncbi:unnamed protein product [Pneumocystis jirovecii]|uniref:Proteasome assembly chaperone 1 n=1 Tax=Pneumocystis jirovecii TaxID=42068 RepID=L0PFU7_PNEJI|nr:unnamed protein product [Pneumocystis jirovecii]
MSFSFNLNFHEEPPKRYSLNDSETSSEEDSLNDFSKYNINKKTQNECKIKCVNSFPNHVSDVIIASELFLDILKRFPGENECQILFQVSENQSIRLFSNSEFSLYSVIFPNNIPIEMCYQISCYIFDHLKFKRIFLLATVFQWSVSSPVSLLRTTLSSLDINNNNYPFLRPPALLSGMEASILSLCEQRNMDAVAIIASSHGPSAHLKITSDVAEHVAYLLDEFFAKGKLDLKVKLQDYNANTKKRTDILTMN